MYSWHCGNILVYEGSFTRCDLLCVRQQFLTCDFVKLFTQCDECGCDLLCICELGCTLHSLESHIAIAQNATNDVEDFPKVT